VAIANSTWRSPLRQGYEPDTTMHSCGPSGKNRMVASHIVVSDEWKNQLP
jgi:hypothetical protein